MKCPKSGLKPSVKYIEKAGFPTIKARVRICETCKLKYKRREYLEEVAEMGNAQRGTRTWVGERSLGIFVSVAETLASSDRIGWDTAYLPKKSSAETYKAVATFLRR